MSEYHLFIDVFGRFRRRPGVKLTKAWLSICNDLVTLYFLGSERDFSFFFVIGIFRLSFGKFSRLCVISKFDVGEAFSYFDVNNDGEVCSVVE